MPPGGTHAAIAPLPVTALRLDPETAARLARLGLRRIGDLTAMPRAALARRFGQRLVRRLDQALGAEPEPISPAPPPPCLAVRLTFPDPIGLEADVLAALDRLLPALSERLRARGLAARRVRLDALPEGGRARAVTVGLARPSADPERIRPLLAMKLGEIDAGFGIDALRVEAVAVEGEVGGPSPARARGGPRRSGGPRGEGGLAPGTGLAPCPRGMPGERGGAGTPTMHAEATSLGFAAGPAGSRAHPPDGRGAVGGADPRAGAGHAEGSVPPMGGGGAAWDRLMDLIGRIGARLGLEAIQRVHPAESHIPEKGHQTLLVAWSEPVEWPRPRAGGRIAGGSARPLLLWRPELVSDATRDADRGRCPAVGRGGDATGRGSTSPGGAMAGARRHAGRSSAGASSGTGRPARPGSGFDAVGPDPEPPGAPGPAGGVSATIGPAPGFVPTAPPARFRWRGRTHEMAAASSVERIAPEWWFDDPQWRTGLRDYWRVTTSTGEALWLFYAHGGRLSPGWFCHGAFA